MTALRLVDAPASPHATSAACATSVARAAALLGSTPTMTLGADASAPDHCCTVRLVRHGDGVWLGIVDDRAAFADHVRMGLSPRFVAGDARVHAVVGTANARLLGRRHEVAAEVRRVVDALVGPWPATDAVVVEIRPTSLALVDDEAHGGPIPQT